MNKTEEQAYKWLLKQGLTEKDIVYQASRTPDFLCADGKKYEAKRLYGDLIWLYNNQLQNLKASNTSIIVMREGVSDPVAIIHSSELAENEIVRGIKIRVVQLGDRSPISLYGDTKKRLIQVLGHMEQSNGKVKSIDQTVNTLIDEYWNRRKEKMK